MENALSSKRCDAYFRKSRCLLPNPALPISTHCAVPFRTSALLNMPVELIGQVLSYFPLWDYNENESNTSPHAPSLTTLSHICLACKALRALAEPVLYSTFVKPESKSRRGRGKVESQTLRKFLRTLLERPELRIHLKTLVLGHWDWQQTHPSPDNPPSAPPPSAFRKLVLCLAEQVSLGARQQAWMQHVRAGYEDAEIALLLIMVPAVKHLAIQIPECRADHRHLADDNWYRTVLRASLEESTQRPFHSFTRLERLTLLRTGYHGYHCPLPVISELCRIPSLRRLDGWFDMNTCLPLRDRDIEGCDPVEMEMAKERQGRFDVVDGASSISSIDLFMNHENVVRRGYAAILVRSCRNLEHFKCRYAIDIPMLADQTGNSNIDDMMYTHHSTLKSLTLDGYQRYRDFTRHYDANDRTSRVRSLRGMKVLRKLQLHQSVILVETVNDDIDDDDEDGLVQLLPRCIEELTITGVTTRLLPRLKGFFAGLSRSFPELTTLKMKIEPLEWEVTEGLWKVQDPVDAWVEEFGVTILQWL